MTNDFLSDLCFYCTDSISRPEDEEQKQALAEYETLEQELIQAMGMDFVDRYLNARLRARAWEHDAIFLAGLRFGVNFMLTLFPYSSNSTWVP